MTLKRLMTAAAALTLTSGAAMAQSPAAQGPAPAPAAAPAATAAAPVAPNGDLDQTLRLSGQFKTFTKAVDATNLTQLLKANKLTVFAPTDAAFASLPPGQLDKLMADKPALQKLVLNHIVNAPLASSTFKGKTGALPTGAQAQVVVDGGGDVLKVNDAEIVQADVNASNGVIHVINKVLTPGAPATAAAAPAATGAAAPAATPAAAN